MNCILKQNTDCKLKQNINCKLNQNMSNIVYSRIARLTSSWRGPKELMRTNGSAAKVSSEGLMLSVLILGPGPRSSVLGPGSWVLGPGSSVLGPGSSVLGPRPWVLVPGSSVRGPQSCVEGIYSLIL